MQLAPNKTVVDLENRATFMVQLHAFLLQARHVVSGTPKGKLQEVLRNVDEWIKEVSLGDATTSSGSASGNASVTERTGGEASGPLRQGASEADTGAAEDPKPPPNSSPSASPCEDPSPATAVAAEGDERGQLVHPDPNAGFSSDLSKRNLEDLARFLATLFVGTSSENGKLRNIARNAARIVITRCFSIIDNTLRQVLREVYDDPTANNGGEAGGNGAARRKESNPLFVSLGHDINVCRNTIGICVDTLSGSTDFPSVRFAVQVCIDILKQLRQCVVHFERQFASREIGHIQDMVEATGNGHNGEVRAADDEEDRCMAEQRVEELKRLLGPTLLESITHLVGLVRPVVGYLFSIVSVKSATASEDERTTKSDVVSNLFGLAKWYGRTSHLSRCGDASVDDSVTLSRSTEFDDNVPIHSRSHRILCCVLESVLATSFSPEYTACVAQHCGDRAEGQFLAVRLLKDTVSELCEGSAAELEYVLRHDNWRKRILDGIFNCVMSLRPSVLDAGLETLRRVVTSCPDCLSTEVGSIYCNGIFGLLGSDSTPPFMQRSFLHHIIDTFFQGSAVSGEAPLLLRCYRRFDLNVHWHQLNLIQKVVTVLSRAVCTARPEEFVDIEGPKPRASGTASGSAAGNAEASNESIVYAETGGGDSANVTQTVNCASFVDDGTVMMQRSMPFLALHGLALVVEILTKQIPQNTGLSNWKPLPRLLNRKKKIEQLHFVEAINSSPIKGLRKLFNIRDEEWQTEADRAIAENNWSHRHIPEPATPQAEEKVQHIAQFLMETPSLNSDAVAEILSYPAVISLQVCRAFMDLLPLAGKTLINGLRELFRVVKLPKEGQRIERLIEFFCSAYYKAGSRSCVDTDVFPFASEDACFIAGIGIIMLNTNLHNPNVSTTKMTAASFYAQMRGCNDNKDFPRRFTDSVFEEVSTRSLSNVHESMLTEAKRRGSVVSHMRMDAFFFTSEDRKEAEFNVVRRRLTDETRELLFRSSRLCEDDGEIREGGDTEQEYWTSVTQDLFLSTWPSLNAVFGAAVDGNQIPEDALLLYATGLRSSLLLSAAFGLHTECDAAQMALVRLSAFDSLRDVCHGCLLEVASSRHSVHFSSRCWLPVVELLVTIRKEQSQTQSQQSYQQQSQSQQQQRRAILVQMESLFGHLEEITREYCNMSVHEAPPVIVVAVRELLQGVAALLRDQGMDFPTLTAALYVVRRVLSYSVISHDQELGPVVTNLINVRDLSGIVMPALVDVVEARREKGDECLHAVTSFVVDVLSVVWNSCVRDANCSHQAVKLTELANCFCFFQMCHERCVNSSVVQMHMLQGVKELVSCTVLAESSVKQRTTRGVQTRVSFTMALVWERLLHSVAHALSGKSTVGTETCSLAVHVLQKLVLICCGAGSVPPSVQMRQEPLNVLLSLLCNVAYVGGMCSDVESAQSCLAQLSCVCTAALNREVTTSLEATAVTSDEDDYEVDGLNEVQVQLTRRLLQGIQGQDDFTVLHALERICMLLGCHTQETRTEAIGVLRAVSKQLCVRDQKQHLAVQLADTVLQVLLGHTAPGSKSSANTPEAAEDVGRVSFAILNLRTPPTMRKCPAVAFHATLPQLLNFMSHELIVDASLEDVASLGAVVMERCLLPLAVSPKSSSHVRPLAVRSMMQCATLCVAALGKLSESSAAREKAAGDRCLNAIINSVSLVLLDTHLFKQSIVPHNAQYVGSRWDAGLSQMLGAYSKAGRSAIRALSASDPCNITGSRGCVTLSMRMLHEEQVSEHSKVAPNDLPGKKQGTVAGCEEGLSSGTDSTVLSDEQLVEYCNLMAPLLSPLPKVLAAITPAMYTRSERPFSGDEGAGTTEGCEQPVWWSPPPCNYKLMAELLLDAEGAFFAVLWRVNHASEMDQFVMQSVTKGREATPLSKSSALLPHTAVRGGLNAYLSLALQMDFSHLRHVLVEILEEVAFVQSLSSGSRKPRRTGDSMSDSPVGQQLSPREQQHVRSCNVGMYQELTSVVVHWVKNLMYQLAPETSALTGQRQSELADVVRDPEVFKGLVQLLTAAGGSIVSTVRDYLTWYIEAQQR
ncbi:hypothetical protein, conserved [Trypanosoma brucei gambiense DAL972]|uniref:SEC7 domain-containing protein n=1 Tax=Trypanosoma brucei gambiense (strain MHOM/CI/86/DAL972) TaxID=679716 RepID=C9ZUV9_TRYB9|nr:hypothetical protein, conserved [Trypanosoma brucei gambiense DAL972]CBH13197.1 hypothetical protein, conserved [Trypanosoma brucei gambiense DAL972]|eukprot:XP_011775474.1 hypothetical protein, conserved [Trypanosoma brucei gambiense DAL972]